MAAKTTAANVTRGAPAASGLAPAGNVLTELLAKGRPLVMGVLNVTPDSFSDGGRFLEPTAALVQARRLVGEGADIIDVGAESTRPYGDAIPVSLEEERRRLAAVLPAIIGLGAPVSIDTMKAPVAAWALETEPQSSTMSGGCSATPTWRASSAIAAPRSLSCTTARKPIRQSTSSPR